VPGGGSEWPPVVVHDGASTSIVAADDMLPVTGGGSPRNPQQHSGRGPMVGGG